MNALLDQYLSLLSSIGSAVLVLLALHLRRIHTLLGDWAMSPRSSSAF